MDGPQSRRAKALTVTRETPKTEKASVLLFSCKEKKKTSGARMTIYGR